MHVDVLFCGRMQRVACQCVLCVLCAVRAYTAGTRAEASDDAEDSFVFCRIQRVHGKVSVCCGDSGVGAGC